MSDSGKAPTTEGTVTKTGQMFMPKFGMSTKNPGEFKVTTDRHKLAVTNMSKLR